MLCHLLLCANYRNHDQCGKIKAASLKAKDSLLASFQGPPIVQFLRFYQVMCYWFFLNSCNYHLTSFPGLLTIQILITCISSQLSSQLPLALSAPVACEDGISFKFPCRESKGGNYYKRSKTGWWEGLETWLPLYTQLPLDCSYEPSRAAMTFNPMYHMSRNFMSR